MLDCTINDFNELSHPRCVAFSIYALESPSAFISHTRTWLPLSFVKPIPCRPVLSALQNELRHLTLFCQPLKKHRHLAIVNVDSEPISSSDAHQKTKDFMEQESRAQMAYRVHKNRFPMQIWHCCTQLCFATIATDTLQYLVFDEQILIHEYAESCHAAAENLSSFIERRRRGIETSNVRFVAPSRERRESVSGQQGTERQKALREFGKFLVEFLPFLYAQVDSPRGTARPKKKLFTQAICCLLGVSRNVLYNRKLPNPQNATEEELTSLIDTASIRLRQLRRKRIRGTYPSLQSLQGYDC